MIRRTHTQPVATIAEYVALYCLGIRRTVLRTISANNPKAHVEYARSRRSARLMWLLAAGFLLLIGSSSAGNALADPADKEAAKEATAALPGILLQIPLPVEGNLDNRVKAMIQRAQLRLKQNRQGDERPVLVLEFVPREKTEFGEGSDFTRALALASFLASRELADVKTVAYLPQTIKGHGILVAMACEEIVMAPEARWGDAAADGPQGEEIPQAVRSGYEQIVNRRKTVPLEIAIGMLDPAVEVLKVETVEGQEFVLRRDLAEFRKKQEVLEESVVVARGEVGFLSGREGRALGFVKFLAEDRDAVAQALQLPREALLDDPSLRGEINPRQVRIEGKITARKVEQIKGMINEVLRPGDVNFLLIEVDSSGGSLADSSTLANFLRGIDPAEVRTVAYVRNAARADASAIVVACDEVVMHSEAILGGSVVLPTEKVDLENQEIAVTIDGQQLDDYRHLLMDELGFDAHRGWSLPVALVDPRLDVYQYKHNETGQIDYFSENEWQSKDDAQQWQRGNLVTQKNMALGLSGQRANRFGVASHVVQNRAELLQLYGVDESIELLEPRWVDELVEALAQPGLAILLLTIAGIAILAELNLPGTGVGAFVASICFLLFFWSQFLNQTADWLEVVLFLGGLVFLLLEIFVLPGFGVFGVGGGLMILVSLILANQTFVFPQNSHELRQLQTSLGIVAISGVGVITFGIILRRYLPELPMFNRIILSPPAGEQAEQLSERESLADYSDLLGETGTVVAQLTPAGKARFGDQYVDVISDSELIERGSKIKVVNVRGNAIYVERVVEE